MIIKTENIRRLHRIFEKVRVPKHAYYGSVYLNFEEGFLSFRNDVTIVKSDLIVEGLEDQESMFVTDGDKFFFLVNSYNELILEEGVFKTEDGNTFDLSSFKEDYELPEFSYLEYEKVEITFNEEVKNSLKKSLYYAASETNDLHGVFIQDNNLIALQPNKVFQAKLESNIDFGIPYDFLSLLSSMASEDSELYKDNNKNSFLYKDTVCEMKFVSNSSLSMPVDVNDPNFVSSYNHETYFTIDKSTLLEGLKFLSYFSKEVVNSRLLIHFLPDSSELLFTVTDETNKVDYRVNVVNFSDDEFFTEKYISISLNILNTAISHLTDSTIVIRVDDSKPAIKLENSSSDDEFIILTRIKDE